MLSSSNFFDDIKLFDVQVKEQKFQTVNKICQKVINGEYETVEIDTFIEKSLAELPSDQKIDHFQKYFITKLIESTKNIENVIKLLKTENDYLIKHVIDNYKFLWDDKTFDIIFCMNSIFPLISYSNRIRLIEAFGKNLKSENKVDNCFEILKNNFSFSSAKYILKYCSENLILEYLKRGVQLSCSEILKILPHRKEFILKYLRECYDMLKIETRFSHRIKVDNYKKIFKNLLQSHPVEIIKIFNDYGYIRYFSKFGKNMVKNILKNQVCKNIILNNSNLFLNYLNRSVLFKSLNEEEYKIFYRNMFPREKGEFSRNKREKIMKYLDYYESKEKKLALILETYSNVYYEDLLGAIKDIPEIMKLLNTEKRLEFAKELYVATSKYTYITYFTCDEGIPLLKNKIYHSSYEHNRIKLLELMIECCEINEDMHGFLEVLKYINQRHRNEKAGVRICFLEKLNESSCLRKFNFEHWKEINDILKLVIINEETNNVNVSNILREYVKFHVENDLSIDGCIEFITAFQNYYVLEELIQKSVKYKTLLLQVPVRPEKYTERSRYDWGFGQIIKLLTKWNKFYHNDEISISNYKWMCNIIEEDIKTENEGDLKEYYEICKYDEKFSNLYLNQIRSLQKGTLKNFDWYIKENPDAIYNHFDHFCDSTMSKKVNRKNVTFKFLKSKKFKHPKIQDKLLQYYTNILKNPIVSNKKQKFTGFAVQFLVHSMKPNEFFEYVKEHFPQKEDIDIKISEENLVRMHYIRKSLAKCLHLFKNDQKVFEVLQQFCNSRYLRFTVGSLNSICMRLPYYKIEKFLNSCLDNDSPIPFKKQIIRLQILISNREYVLTNIFKKLWRQENNLLLRKFLLKTVFKIFLLEPNTEIWNILKEYCENINEEETDVLKFLALYENIPLEYISNYIELMWLTVLRLENNIKYVDAISYKTNLSTFLLDSCELIEDSIIFKILQDHFYIEFENAINIEPHLKIQLIFQDLAIKFILKSPKNHHYHQEQKIQLIIEKMKNCFEFFSQIQNINFKKSLKMKEKFLIDFLTKFCTVCMEKRNNHENTHMILMNIQNKLQEIFDPSIYMFETLMKVKFTTILIQNANSLKDFGKNIRNTIDNEIAEYGTYIIRPLSSILKLVVGSLESGKETKMNEVINGLLDLPLQSIGCALMVINLISVEELLSNEYKQALMILKEIVDKRIQNFLSDLDLEEE